MATALALIAMGAFITLMAGRDPVLSGLHMVLFGLAAVTVTFGLG